MKNQITFTISNENQKVIETYAKYKKQTLTQFINEAINEKIEDIYGAIRCKEILKDKKNLKTRPYRELQKEVLNV